MTNSDGGALPAVANWARCGSGSDNHAHYFRILGPRPLVHSLLFHPTAKRSTTHQQEASAMGDIGQPLRKIEVLPIETPLLPTNPTPEPIAPAIPAREPARSKA